MSHGLARRRRRSSVFALPVPDPAALYLSSAASRTPTATSRCENIATCSSPILSLPDEHQISLATALVGALFGFSPRLCRVSAGCRGWLRPTLLTFSGVASNFAGVPLAFAFIATLGRIGLVTTL